jgi:signal transduction histidine kinase
MLAESKLMDQLIQDLLAFSRLAHIEVPMEPVDAREAIEAALHNLRHDIAERHATVQITGEMPVLQANRTLLVQALTNLLSNAFKFGGDYPIVKVQAERAGDDVRISVEDYGIGIAPQHHDRVFRAFERLHGVEAFPGTGMGLAIVRKGIERLGGRVGVESAEGQGSRFWIELPRAEAA